MIQYLLTTGVGEYVAEVRRKPVATGDADRAKRFGTAAEAEDWGARKLGDRRFWVHECLPSFVRMTNE